MCQKDLMLERPDEREADLTPGGLQWLKAVRTDEIQRAPGAELEMECSECDAPVGSPCRDLRSQAAWMGEVERAFPIVGFHRARRDAARKAEAGRRADV